MSRKFQVHLEGFASASILVKLDDDEVAEVEAEVRKAYREADVNDVSADDVARAVTDQLIELVSERVFEQGVPDLCAACAGWGSDDSLSLGDEWEPHKVWDPVLGRKRDARPHEYVDEVKD